jgi:type IV secretory pathway VirB2 component (pilin)
MSFYFLSYIHMTKLQVLGYSLAGVMLSAANGFAAINFDTGDKAKGLQGGTSVGEQAFVSLIVSFLGFITLIAVLYVLWAGFQILTAGGDEEKVKKGRTTIIQVVIGIVIMWLAYALVKWIMSALV